MLQNFINGGRRDYCGWGQLTYHNELTGANGLNALIVPNFTVLPNQFKKNEVLFKTPSFVLGSSGLISMYSLKLGSANDAARLFYMLVVLQQAAKMAKQVGHPVISFPSPNSAQAAIARAMYGNDVPAQVIDCHLAMAQLDQLVQADPVAFSVDRKWVVHFGEDCPFIPRPYQALEALEEGSETDLGSLNDDDDDANDNSSDGSDAVVCESQDWRAAFRR